MVGLTRPRFPAWHQAPGLLFIPSLQGKGSLQSLGSTKAWWPFYPWFEPLVLSSYHS